MLCKPSSAANRFSTRALYKFGTKYKHKHICKNYRIKSSINKDLIFQNSFSSKKVAYRFNSIAVFIDLDNKRLDLDLNTWADLQQFQIWLLNLEQLIIANKYIDFCCQIDQNKNNPELKIVKWIEMPDL